MYCPFYTLLDFICLCFVQGLKNIFSYFLIIFFVLSFKKVITPASSQLESYVGRFGKDCGDNLAQPQFTDGKLRLREVGWSVQGHSLD